jgi:RNA polymerase sigma-70 factor (ECF subfamily)
MDFREKQNFADWAHGIKASNQQAFSKLFYRLYPQLVKFAWRYTRTEPPAKDIVQDAFLKLWEKRDNIDPKQSIKAYLFQIVRNKSLNYLRDAAPFDNNIEDLSQEMMKSYEYVPEVTTTEDQLGKKMLQWIDELPGRQREAIRLSRFEGFDHEEIASVMDISARTVNNHIVAALKTLRKNWDDYKKTQT